MPKAGFFLLPVVLSAAIASAQMDQVSHAAEPNFENAVVGSTLTCSQPHTLVVPSQLLQKARLEARLLILLRDSLYDDARGVVNIEREKEIKKLANKLRTKKTTEDCGLLLVEGLTAAQVFQAAVENAPRELRRSSQKLAFSGIAGGLTMGPTGLAVAAVHAFTVPCESLPLAPYLLYSIGLVAVIIGRAQLFTENTLCLLQRFQISEDCLSI